MKKTKKFLKRICVFATAFILIGGVLFGVGFLSANGGWKKLSHLTATAHTYTEKTDNEIDSVTISYDSSTTVSVHFSDTADVVSVSYGSLHTKSGKSVGTLSVTDTNGHLKIQETYSWKDIFRSISMFNFSTKIKVDVTLPAARTYSLSIYTNTGDVVFDGEAGNVSALRVEGDTADISLRNDIVCADSAMIETDTGDIWIKNLTAKKLDLETDTGDITIGNITVNTLFAEIDTGDFEIVGKITADSVSIATDTGDVTTKDNGIVDADVLRLEADTGDISLTLAGKLNDYNISIKIDTGKTNVSKQQIGGSRNLTIETDTGDVYVYFEE